MPFRTVTSTSFGGSGTAPSSGQVISAAEGPKDFAAISPGSSSGRRSSPTA